MKNCDYLIRERNELKVDIEDLTIKLVKKKEDLERVESLIKEITCELE